MTRFSTQLRAAACGLAAALALIPAGQAMADPVAAPATTAATTATAQSAPVQLRMAFVPGETHRYALAMRTAVSSPDLPAAGRYAATMEMELSYAVEHVHDDGSATVRATIDRMDLALDGSPAGAGPLVGLTTRSRMLPDGQTVDVVLDPASAAQLGLPAGLTLPQSEGAGGSAALGGGSIGVALPAQGLRVGESFERTMAVDLSAFGLAEVGLDPGTPLTAQSRVTLERLTDGRGGPVATLSEVGALSLPPYTVAEGASVSLEMTVRSLADVDVRTGWLGAGETAGRGRFRLSAPDGQGMTMDMEVTATIRPL